MSDAPVPTVGRIVHYTLSEKDAEEINRRREDAVMYRANPYNDPRVAKKPTGFQIHTGNPAKAGDVLPMIIVRVWSEIPDGSVNGKVLLDGNDDLWVTSVPGGEGERRWAWPAPARIVAKLAVEGAADLIAARLRGVSFTRGEADRLIAEVNARATLA